MRDEIVTQNLNFNAIKLKVASPEDILNWSFGEVLKPETINYRTQKPEKDGLFCEKIFGPSKDWECYCGKYKKIRYKGIICDKCGVEVTRSIVRRERMGHIELSTPVSHIWFLRGVPSKIGLMLDLSVQELEKVIYFANFIITNVDSDLRDESLGQIEIEFQAKKKSIEAEFSRIATSIEQRKLEKINEDQKDSEKKKINKEFDEEIKANAEIKEEKMLDLAEAVDLAKKELKQLKPMQIISEQMYRDLSLKYGHVFEASIGAEAIRNLLLEVDLDKIIKELEVVVVDAPESKKKRLIRRLRLYRSFKKNKFRPEWLVMTHIPVIPPDLRPMVQLDGGRFAASDLNDLYRRVINRNNRLKRLVNLNAPEVIRRNEKRMLQEAVDALIDNNARHGKTVTASTGQKRMLKSIADILKGKQGRFRQNLLGKRVDYSGRSVIVVGPHLKMSECGLPKKMALELFKPFIISQLIKREFVHNVRSAGRFIESGRPEVWDILEEVTKDSHVLLNRAPTLHRLGIQAFKPVLIEGLAIQIHPSVCPAFNADFDGDQMAVHVPLTENAKKEAAEIIASVKNILKPSTGSPVVAPQQDLVLGCYYLSKLKEKKEGVNLKILSSREEALMAYELKHIHIQEQIKVKLDKEVITTSAGRIIFNDILPKDWGYINEVMDRKALVQLIADCLNKHGNEETVLLLDNIKELAFNYLTNSGISWGMSDLIIPTKKKKIMEEAENQVEEIQSHYEQGLLTDDERHVKVIEIWSSIKDEMQKISREALDPNGPVYAMIESGARGSWGQTTQMMGMKGLVTNPSGDTIELPVKGSFKEGFDVLEYFISTHGARKGLSDTALRTANAGYLTRRLVDVSQDIIITEHSCKTKEGFAITRAESEEMGDDFEKRLLGRALFEDIINPKTKKVVIEKNEIITEELLPKIEKLKLDEVKVRSVILCRAKWGVCKLCYGNDLGYNKLVEMGTAVGIIAAQSIGEPGTQLTMRTFHTGGVAGSDITQGLPRVEEIFEARPIKNPAIMADVTGQIVITDEAKGAKKIVIKHKAVEEEKYVYRSKKVEVKVKDGDKVKEGDILFNLGNKETIAKNNGVIKIEEKAVLIIVDADKEKEYIVPSGQMLRMKNGDLVVKGDRLTDGSIDLHQLFFLKGQEAVQRYMIKEIQYIYSSQGQKLNDKHIEIIVKQIFSRIYIKDPADTNLVSGEIVEKTNFLETNDETRKEGGKEAVGEQLLLGITKASLSIDSFLSAASFQETARVLIDAAVTGKVDRLRGLKENVIIGKLIPAGTGYKK
ncbi:MAG: DNA-directed RNA polymerase subunit beta' [Candidatus Kerfeldbacteria bacterium]